MSADTLGSHLRFRNGRALPDNAEGDVPVFGANGCFGYTALPNVETASVVIGRVGTYCGSVHYTPGGAWVTENALIATPRDEGGANSGRFWAYALGSLNLNSWRSGSGQPLLNQTILSNVPFDAPPLPEQQAIAEVLGALDDKISANTKLAATAAQLARTFYMRSIADGSRVLEIGELAKLVTRGITPRYVDEDEDGAVLVLNQKCVRDQRAGLDSARWTSQTAIREHKMLERYDLLVNSTGMGTLGRVAPWWRDDAATVDSHITIVRPNADECHPAVIMEAICAVEPRIEALGEGSTGQTELSRVELGKLPIRLPDAHKAEVLGPILEGLAAMSLSLEAENRTLAATRDALLPQLMSGTLRVRELDLTGPVVD